MPILVFLGLSVLDLGPIYVTDVRRTDVRQRHRFILPPIGAGHNNSNRIDQTQSEIHNVNVVTMEDYTLQQQLRRLLDCSEFEGVEISVRG